MKWRYLDRGLTFWRVNSEKGTRETAELYLLQAYNVAYPQLSIKKSEIKHICKVVMKEFL